MLAIDVVYLVVLVGESLSLASPYLFPTTSPTVCPDPMFRCNNGDCISASWQCDGTIDCDNDEVDCEGKLVAQ